MKTGAAMLAGLALFAGVSTAAAQSKGYRPPPPPPRSAPVAPSPSPSRLPSTPPSRPQGSTSSPPSPLSKSGAPLSSTKGASTQPSTNYAKLNSAELQKAIGSQTRQIDAYRSRVNNPRASYPNWDALSRDQQSALLRQWNGEIRRHETSRATAQRMLSQRAR